MLFCYDYKVFKWTQQVKYKSTDFVETGHFLFRYLTFLFKRRFVSIFRIAHL